MKALSNLVLGKNGIINFIKKDSYLLIVHRLIIRLHYKFQMLLQKKNKIYRCSVSGGVSGQTPTLTIMVGGKKTYNGAKEILNFGKNIIYVGKSGTGQIVKACNNMMLGINMIGVCEAFLLAKKYKIDLKKFYDITSKSSGSSWAMNTHLPIKGIVNSSAANNNFKPGYAAKLILKDLSIAKQMAKKISLNIFMGNKAHNLYNSFCKKIKIIWIIVRLLKAC